MAYDPHTLITLGGTLAEEALGDEIWEIGVRGFYENGVSIGPVPEAGLQDLVDSIATGDAPTAATWFEDSQSCMASSATLNYVKAANIGADGKYTTKAYVHAFATPVAGPVAGQVPSFMSACLSFTTDVNAGRRNRYGRVYPPNFGAGLAAGTAKVLASDVTKLVTSATELLQVLSRGSEGFGFTPYLVSKSGGHAKITGVRVGNVWDVQRRRKNAVREVYASAAFPG